MRRKLIKMKGRELKAHRRCLANGYKAQRERGERKFARWWRGRLLVPMDYGGELCWDIAPAGKGLIHKGRKP